MSETETPKLLPAETNTAPSQQTVKEIQGLRDRMIIARNMPRDVAKSQERIAASCRRPSFAEKAIYKLPRGSKTIEGPSINLALEIARSYGNMDVCMGREIPTDDDRKTVLEVSATDLETNFHVSEILSVKHVRYTKQDGLKPLDNPDDIYMVTAARASKRVRECILKVVPRDITELAIDQCKQTSSSTAGIEQRVAAMVQKFAALGVNESMLTDLLKKPLKDIIPVDFQNLAAIYTNIADEGGAITDHFGVNKDTGEVTAKPGPEVVLVTDVPKQSGAPATPAKPSETVTAASSGGSSSSAEGKPAPTDAGTGKTEPAAAASTGKGAKRPKSMTAAPEIAPAVTTESPTSPGSDTVDATIVEDLFSV